MHVHSKVSTSLATLCALPDLAHVICCIYVIVCIMHNSILVLSYLLDHMPLTISLHSRIEAAPPDFFFFLQLRCMGDVVDLAYL